MNGRQIQINWQESRDKLFRLSQNEIELHNQRRLQTLCLLRQGKSIKEAAHIANVHYRTAQQWVAWYRQGGIEEVRRHRPGRLTNYIANHDQIMEVVPADETIVKQQSKMNIVPVNVNYQFESDESVPDGIRRIVAEQIDRAIWQLTDPPHGRDKGIHDARKSFKKVRAVARLVRDEVGPELFRRENACFRDAGRLLAPIRESAVLIATLDNVCNRFACQLAPNAFAGVREELVENYRATSRRVLDEEDSVAKVVETLQAARQRVPDWSINHKDFTAFYGGMWRVYRRGCNRLRDAYAAPSSESFHEWRKRLKYLWYHTRLLKLIWPNQMLTLTGELDSIADWLGENHDLAELRLAVTDRPEIFANEGEYQVLIALIEYWRHELEAIARPVGQRIYVERPKAFVDRIGAYWNIWRAEARVSD